MRKQSGACSPELLRRLNRNEKSKCQIQSHVRIINVKSKCKHKKKMLNINVSYF